MSKVGSSSGFIDIPASFWLRMFVTPISSIVFFYAPMLAGRFGFSMIFWEEPWEILVMFTTLLFGEPKLS